MKAYCIYFFAAFYALVVFTSCAYKPRQVLFESATSAKDSSAKKESPVYKIHPQDVLQVRNLQNISYVVSTSSKTGEGSSSSGNAENTYQVEENGTVALPVIGRVEVGGLTRLQAALKIEELYKKQLLKDPIIDVRIVNLKVTVLGEVKTQGNFPLLKDNTTLVDVLGEAGGFTENADEKTVKIIRGDRRNPQIIYSNLNQISALADDRLILQNNDIIYVMQNKRSVRKEALQNINTWLQPALILLNTALVIYSVSK